MSHEVCEEKGYGHHEHGGYGHGGGHFHGGFGGFGGGFGGW